MYKPWFPQRSILDTPVAVLKNFIFYLNVPISRYTIEKTCKEHPDFPNFSDTHFTEILNSWGISTLTINADVQILDKLPCPSLLFIQEQNGNINQGLFVMMFNIENDTIEYLHSRKGWVIESLKDFELKWTKAAFVVTNIDSSKGEPGYEEKENQYEQEKFDNPGRKNVLYRRDFLTPQECEYIINTATPLCKPSPLMQKEGNEHYRTSFTADLILPGDEILNSIRLRAAEWLKIPVTNFEFFQCVMYGPGQEYQTHYDTFDDKHENGRNELEQWGQRKYTLLAYLNDDFTGGETYFPNLDLLIQPQTGCVLAFENIDEEEKVHKSALHAGLPVTTGTKYAMNMWIRTKPVRN